MRAQLQRGEAQLQRTKLRARNPERLARLRAEQFGPQAALCRSLPCCACASPPPSDPAHVVARGRGGKDRANVVPLCRRCHDEQHHLGIAEFEARRGVSLSVVAAKLAAQLIGDDEP